MLIHLYFKVKKSYVTTHNITTNPPGLYSNNEAWLV